MIKIAIFGGGVGGCTVAHELSKIPNYDINIYEKKNEIGGLARSSRDSDLCATEYCWRAYFSFYKNVFKIMNEIPLIDDSNKTVLNNLIACSNTNISDDKISWHDTIISLKSILYGITSCDSRLNELDNLTWWEALDGSSNSHLFRAIGPWLGADRYNYSYESVIKVGIELDIFPSLFSSKVRNYITTKPTSEAWFNHWQTHLENNKVKINFGVILYSVEIINNKIISCTVINNNIKKIIIADYYIFALPLEVLDIIIRKTPELQCGDFLKIPQLKKIGLHMQLSFQLYLDRSVSLGEGEGIFGKNHEFEENNTFFIVDSAWDITILQYDKVYKDTQLCGNIPEAKGGWSVAACTAYIPGIVFGKPLNQCTYDEIIIELWEQMYRSPELQKIIKKNNGYYLEPYMVIKWSPMWPTYFFDETDGKLKTSEPKFTNNAGTYQLRPSYKTPIDNLFISTAYIKETMDIFSMEAAAIAGRYVASAISGQNMGPVIVPRPALMAPFRAIDNVFYKMGLPNIGPLLIAAIVMIIIIFFIIFIKNILIKLFY